MNLSKSDTAVKAAVSVQLVRTLLMVCCSVIGSSVPGTKTWTFRWTRCRLIQCQSQEWVSSCLPRLRVSVSDIVAFIDS